MLAAIATVVYLVVNLVLPLVRRYLSWPAPGTSTLRVRYPGGHGILRRLLNEATQRGFAIDDLSVETIGDGARAQEHDGKHPIVAVRMQVHGKRPVSELATALTDLDLVDAVVATNQPTDE